MTIDHLKLIGGGIGVWARSGIDSDRVTVSNNEIVGSGYFGGIDVEPSNGNWNILNNSVHDAASRAGISAVMNDGSDVQIVGNTVFNISVPSGINALGTDGISVGGGTAASRVSNNVVYGAPIGILAYHFNYGITFGGTIDGNTVHDAVYGISVYDQPTIVRNNVVSKTTVGIITAYGGTVIRNRVFANTDTGIIANEDTVIDGNQVYSNPTGIWAGHDRTFFGVIQNNLVYADTNRAIYVQNARANTTIWNNTAYQSVGDALRIETGSSGVSVRNNILWSENGYVLYISPDSQAGVDSDRNILYTGPSNSGTIQTIAGKDVHSQQANPNFVDIDGIDNVLGYSSAGGGKDYGADDNFFLSRGSLAIDHGDTTSFATTDLFGNARVDEPTVANSPGIADVGAIEFRGNGTDVTAPKILSVTPVFGGSAIASVTVTFSEPVNPVDAVSNNAFTLRGAGPDGLFGTTDDRIVTLVATYAGGTTLSLAPLGGGTLPTDTYRLTSPSNAATSSGIHDLSGNVLDGDANNTPGGDFSFNLDGTDHVPPTLNTATFRWQTLPQAIVLVFSEDVGASLQAGDFQLTNLTTGVTYSSSVLQVVWNAATRTATITMPSLIGSANVVGTLPDGRYRFRTIGAGITDAAGNALVGTIDTIFTNATGDSNNDGKVDFNDLLALARNYNRPSDGTPATGDFNYDGTVDFNDLLLLAKHYNANFAAGSATTEAVASVTPVAAQEPAKPTRRRSTDAPDVLA